MRLFRRWEPADRLPVLDDRFTRVLQLVEGKDVLDCGCIGWTEATPRHIQSSGHSQIAKKAKSCLGVDISKDGVERYRALGFNMVVADVEQMALGRQFDIIVAADLLEHLANPGLFLERAREHLRDGGLLYLVTPNAHSLNTSVKALLGKKTAVNPEHTCWYDPATLRQLVTRYGFHPREEYWQDYRPKPIVQVAVRIRPNLAHHYVLIAEKAAVHESR